MNQLTSIFIPTMGLLLLVMMSMYSLSLMSELQQKQAAKNQLQLIATDSTGWAIQKKRLDDTLRQCHTDFQKTTILREFVAKHADLGFKTTDVEQLDTNWYNQDIAYFYTVFEQDRASAKCGVVSRMLQLLYDLYGFESVRYDMGKLNSSLTHVTTLVNIVQEGKKQLIVQDAMFNYTLTDTKGQAKDFYTLLGELKQNKTDDVQRLYSSKPVYTESLLNYAENPDQFLAKNNACPDRIREVIAAADSTQKHKIVFKRDLEMIFDCDTQGQQYLTMLEEEGFPNDFHYLYLMPINIIGKNASSIQATISLITDQKHSPN